VGPLHDALNEISETSPAGFARG